MKGRLRVSNKSFMVDDKLVTGFYPEIKIEGKWVYIHDDNFEPTMLRAETRYKALKLGREVIERMDERGLLAQKEDSN